MHCSRCVSRIGVVMAKTWIQDRWLRKAATVMVDGREVSMAPSAGMKRSLSRNMDHPERANVPEGFRTAQYGRGARWMVCWQTAEGRKRRNFRDYRDAEEFAAGLEDDLRSGRYVNPNDAERLVREAAELWVQALHGQDKGATEFRYLRELRVWVLPRWGDVPVGRVTTAAVQRWVGALSDGTAPRDGRCGSARPLAPKTIRSVVMIVFRAVMGVAVSSGWLRTNPVGEVKVPRSTVVSRRVYLVPEEIKAIADEMTETDATAVYLLAYTGIRIGELLALRCSDVDFDACVVHVDRTQSVDAKGCVVETIPKGNRARTVPVPAGLIGRVNVLTAGHGDDEYLVRAPRGGRWTVCNWRNRVWYPALRAAGMDEIDGLVVHSLRHSYASMAIKAGADVKSLQVVMGHASATETLDTYADLWPDGTQSVARAVNGMLVM